MTVLNVPFWGLYWMPFEIFNFVYFYCLELHWQERSMYIYFVFFLHFDICIYAYINILWYILRCIIICVIYMIRKRVIFQNYFEFLPSFFVKQNIKNGVQRNFFWIRIFLLQPFWNNWISRSLIRYFLFYIAWNVLLYCQIH